MTGLVVFMVICGGIGAFVRNGKGEPLEGFLAGLFLGPIGVILAAVWATERHPSHGGQVPRLRRVDQERGIGVPILRPSHGP